MAYIDLGLDETVNPGIRGLLRYAPDTARPLMELAEVLLRAPNTLSPGERELIAAYVSGLNDCTYCSNSHAAFAAAQLDEGQKLIAQVRADLSTAPVSEKLRALLRIAAATRASGSDVTEDLIAAARAADATDREIHDTVLIAAAFSMFNRYVDGLGSFSPADPAPYEVAAARVVERGYLASAE